MNQAKFNQLLFGADTALRAYAMNLTRDNEAANDLYQETAFKAYKHREKFQEDSNFNAWVFTLMKNTFINEYRRKKRRNTLLDATADSYLLNSSDKVVRNEGESNLTITELTQLIDKLPEKLKTPFLLSYQGYSIQEIAQELEIPEGTVKSRVHFARKRLKKDIQKNYYSRSVAELVA